MEKEPNQESTQKPKSDTKIDGVSCQINLGIGSPTHLRFARLMTSSGAQSVRDFCNVLMDAYENPDVSTDNSEVIANLENQVNDLKHENESMAEDYNKKVAELEANLEEARRVSNENAEVGNGKQLELEAIQRRIEGAVILKPNPVVMYFLEQMASRTDTTPDKILERLFLDDLQNPMANNLPYVVTSSEIRKVMEDLKTRQQ